MNLQLIDTQEALLSMLAKAQNLRNDPPSFYFDCEGYKLGRFGTLDLLQLHILPLAQTFVIDLFTLQHQAFNVPDSGCTLQDILESESIAKVFFDVRNDSDALYSHFQVRVRGVVDLQLLEYFQPGRIGRHLLSLKACIERDCNLLDDDRCSWILRKQKGLQMLMQNTNARPYPCQQRPLSRVLLHYCAGDVQYLPHLFIVYSENLSKQTWKNIARESKRRVTQSQQPTYDPQGKGRGKGPYCHARQAGTQRDRHLQSSTTRQGMGNSDPKEQPATPFPSITPAVGGVRAPEDTPYVDLPIRELQSSCLPLTASIPPLPLRHQPVQFIKEGSRRRHRKKTQSPDHDYLIDDLDWTICDKDCGWCGRCYAASSI